MSRLTHHNPELATPSLGATPPSLQVVRCVASRKLLAYAKLDSKDLRQVQRGHSIVLCRV